MPARKGKAADGKKNERYRKMEDTFRHKGLRRKMIENLQSLNIASKEVLAVMGEIPRHLFLDSVFDSQAYQNKAFSIGDEQTISHPSTVALQSTLLDVFPGAKILEVGTGSGYQAYVLEKLKADVYSIERQKALYLKTKALLASFHSRVHCFYGDGYQGLPQFAPFDRILVTCGAASLPMDLVSQLKIGGFMVIPLGTPTQRMAKVIRKNETELDYSWHGDCHFVPMLPNRTGDKRYVS